MYYIFFSESMLYIKSDLAEVLPLSSLTHLTNELAHDYDFDESTFVVRSIRSDFKLSLLFHFL